LIEVIGGPMPKTTLTMYFRIVGYGCLGPHSAVY
jgi:hypothetical protein